MLLEINQKNLHDAIIALIVWAVFVLVIIPGVLYLSGSLKKKED